MFPLSLLHTLQGPSAEVRWEVLPGAHFSLPLFTQTPSPGTRINPALASMRERPVGSCPETPPLPPAWWAGILEACVKAAGLVAHTGSHDSPELSPGTDQALSSRQESPHLSKPAAPATHCRAGSPHPSPGPPVTFSQACPGSTPHPPPSRAQGKGWKVQAFMWPHLLQKPCDPACGLGEFGQTTLFFFGQTTFNFTFILS